MNTVYCCFLTTLLLHFNPSHCSSVGSSTTNTVQQSSKPVLIFGSSNLDTFLPLKRLPTPGENLTLLPNTSPIIDVPGGKGCNQAIACSKLSSSNNENESDNDNNEIATTKSYFVSRLGEVAYDKATLKLIQVLQENHVNIDFTKQCMGMESGRGYVFLEKDTGKVSAVVSGGSNLYGWDDLDTASSSTSKTTATDNTIHEYLQNILSSINPFCLLLQREIPEFVNLALARHIREHRDDVIILQDIGGEDRPMTSEMLSLCDYIMPNESELMRLCESFMTKKDLEKLGQDMERDHNGKEDNYEHIVKLCRILQGNGANHVLVTLGGKGSILVKRPVIKGDSEVIFQNACKIKDPVVDETGAGDCYRAGFAVALSEGKSIKECMEFASASGALAVTKEGAVPSIPSRKEVEDLIEQNRELLSSQATHVPRGGGTNEITDEEPFPYMFGSRLNSMKDRPELWPKPVDNVREWVRRQGQIKGLGCVDFNWPQHFQTWDPKDAKEALDEVGLVAGAVCLRYPSKFARGAMIHPDPKLRREAIDLTKQAAEVARQLGCNEVVVWSAYDGYDYPFQVDYKEKWNQIVSAFQECCDEYPDIKWSLEYKPTDENTRFFTVPSTGAAMLLLNDINRPNMGLTLDVGHMLMSGENPGQSIAMVGDKLFGIQLNDGYTRLAAEDGMMFGSIHPTMALEIMYQLQENNFRGHFYFDTFPQRSDPILECEYNIRKVKKLWYDAISMNARGIKDVMKEHDAVAALSIIDECLNNT